MLGINKETLFRYRDDGTLKLGPHYAAFDDTFSRDSYRWNVNSVKKHLQEQGLLNDELFCSAASWAYEQGLDQWY